MDFPYKKLSEIPVVSILSKVSNECETLVFLAIHDLKILNKNFAVVIYAQGYGMYRDDHWLQEVHLFQWYDHANELYEKTVKYIQTYFYDWKKQGF